MPRKFFLQTNGQVTMDRKTIQRTDKWELHYYFLVQDIVRRCIYISQSYNGFVETLSNSAQLYNRQILCSLKSLDRSYKTWLQEWFGLM